MHTEAVNLKLVFYSRKEPQSLIYSSFATSAKSKWKVLKFQRLKRQKTTLGGECIQNNEFYVKLLFAKKGEKDIDGNRKMGLKKCK